MLICEIVRLNGSVFGMKNGFFSPSPLPRQKKGGVNSPHFLPNYRTFRLANPGDTTSLTPVTGASVAETLEADTRYGEFTARTGEPEHRTSVNLLSGGTFSRGEVREPSRDTYAPRYCSLRLCLFFSGFFEPAKKQQKKEGKVPTVHLRRIYFSISTSGLTHRQQTRTHPPGTAAFRAPRCRRAGPPPPGSSRPRRQVRGVAPGTWERRSTNT